MRYSWVGFAAVALAVHLQDAFVNDWYLPHLGTARKVSAIGALLFLWLSESSRIAKVIDNKVAYSVPVDGKDFQIVGDYLVVPKDDSISVYELDSGIYIDTYPFENRPLDFAATALQLYVKDDSNKVYVIDGKAEFVGEYSGKLRVTSTGSEDFVAAVDNSVHSITHPTRRIFKNIGLQSESDDFTEYAFLAHLDGDDLVISNKEEVLRVRVSAKSIEVFNLGLKSYVVAVGSEISLFDVTDFLQTLDTDTLTRVEIQRKGELKEVKAAGTDVLFLFTSDAELFIETFSENHIRHYSHPLAESVPLGKAVLVDLPPSVAALKKAHELYHDGYEQLLKRFTKRVRQHLSDLGRALLTKLESEEHVDPFGIEKLLVYYDEKTGKLVGRNTAFGHVAWELSLKGDFVDLVAVKSTTYVVFKHAIVTVNTDGETKTTNYEQEIQRVTVVDDEVVPVDSSLSRENHYILEKEGDTLHGFKLQNGLVPTWLFSKGEILAYSQNEVLTSAPGIKRHDRLVLYKYLNPNLVVVLTKTDKLNVHFLDGITGSVLYSGSHNDTGIDFSSVQLVQRDNWAVYTYHHQSPKVEQKIVVVDLFGEEPRDKSAFDVELPSVVSKAFLFPERILKLASTSSKFGITIKSVIALTESGSLHSLPKFLLNSRRVEGPITQQDMEDDFHMTPYEPTIARNTYQVLNHKHQLIVAPGSQILVAPTELESTAVLCFVNAENEFCTRVQPLLSYDLLSRNFDKVTLVLTIAALLAAYVVLLPFVQAKKLNAKWVD